METRDKGRLIAFDILKGIAILLVVAGHFLPADSPGWWEAVNRCIYSFHMPVFMAASGFLYSLTYRPLTPYGSFVWKKFKRLMIPYFAVSVVICLIKFLTESHLSVDHPVTPGGIVEILYYPYAGFFLWFVWALWWIFVIIPWFKTPRARFGLLIAAAFLAYMPYRAPEIFCLDKAQEMLVFFVAGCVLNDYRRIFDWLTRGRQAIAAVAVFVVLEALYLSGAPWLVWVLPYVSIVAMLALSVGLERGRTAAATAMAFVGIYSFAIYLFHTTFEGLAKAVLAKAAPVLVSSAPGGLFPVGAAIVIAAGVIAPILLYRYIFSRSRIATMLFGR